MVGPVAPSIAERAQRKGTLVTSVLDTRPHRQPDFAAESEAMHRLAKTLTSPDNAMLETLSNLALTLCEAGSAGIALREHDSDGGAIFRWVAVSGDCATALDTIVPAESPSGVALELAAAQLFSFPQRHFTCLGHVTPEVVEELVVPIPGDPEPWGTVWVMSHDKEHIFDSEDRRALISLANFTCAALTITRALRELDAKYQSVIYETYLAGNTVRQAAEILGIPEGTVKSRLYTAMRQLRKALGEVTIR